jgi:putative ABC transport system ATP-binding protein
MRRRPNPKSTRHAIAAAFRLAPALRKGLPVTVALSVVGTAALLVVPILVQQVIDNDVLGGLDVGSIFAKGALSVVAIMIAAEAGRRSMIRLLTASAIGLSDLRVMTLRHLHGLSILHVEAERRGALVSRVTSDVTTIQEFLEWGGMGMLLGSTQVGLALLAMLVYEWRLALVVLASVVLYGTMLAAFQRILGRAHDRVRIKVGESLAQLGEAISGITTVRAHGAEEVTLARVDRAMDDQFRAEFKANRLGAVLFSSADLYAGAITALVVVAGVLIGGVSAGTLLAFLFLVNLLVEPAQMLVETIDSAQRAGAGLRRILEVLETPVEIADPVDATELPEGQLDVWFRHVSFAYPEGPDVLKDLSVHIEEGKRVAVVGETGSGKTTFSKLATRLLEPREGSIEIGGVPLVDVGFEDLRSRVAYVPQQGFLFDASIADNIRYGLPSASDRRVRQALEDLNLGDWLDQLPDGLDTAAGERGSRLSAGERQLVALVRAWIANPDLLVLDEATSSVDPALEVKLRHAIERLTEGRTSITVAHRLATAEASDEVLVFDAGELVERGTHTQLVAAGGVYTGLHHDWAAGSGVR